MFALIVVAVVFFIIGVFVGDKYTIQIDSEVTNVETAVKNDVTAAEKKL